MVGGAWSVVPWSVVGVTVVGGLWSVGGGFVLRRFQCDLLPYNKITCIQVLSRAGFIVTRQLRDGIIQLSAV